ncbi:MAG: hypothetical protein J6O04_00090 [Selenomonadaceae bacterium]|nr:hypothetical protein [Selenomonadaceae bacterium]
MSFFSFLLRLTNLLCAIVAGLGLIGILAFGIGILLHKNFKDKEGKIINTKDNLKSCVKMLLVASVIGLLSFGSAYDWRSPMEVMDEYRQEEMQREQQRKEERQKKENSLIREKEAAEQRKQEQLEAERRENEELKGARIAEWCSRVETLIADTDEQWNYWWPIATGSHDPRTDYDAANTLRLNLQDKFDAVSKEHYQSPKGIDETTRKKMQNIIGDLSMSLWKRIKAAEEYADGIKEGDYSIKKGEGIRSRIKTADSERLKALTSLHELENSIGITPGTIVPSSEASVNKGLTSGESNDGRKVSNI